MESIGEKLRAAREAKKLTVKDVVKDTNISHHYIEALEEEKFDKFPSETYLIGFLRSYAEYLKLDTEKIVQSYKGYKIGESVTPLEELTRPTKSPLIVNASTYIDQYKSVIFIAAIAVAVILVIGGLRAIFKSDIDIAENDSIEELKDEYNAQNRGNEIENIRNLQLQNDKGFILVYKNEAVQFMVDKKEVVFLLRDIKGKSVELELLPGNTRQVIELDEPKTVTVEDLPRDVTFTLKGLTENRAKIMVALGERPEATPEEETVIEEPIMEGDNTSVVALNKKNLKIVFVAEFTEKSFIELYLDGVRKMRGFIPGGTRQRWEATEYIQIKIGNAGGMRANINGKPYVFGKSGQVANKVITWKKDVNNPNLYHIVVNDW